MNRIRTAVAVSLALLAPGAGAQAAGPVPEMSFFITSAGPGKGADLGGLTAIASNSPRRQAQARRRGAPI